MRFTRLHISVFLGLSVLVWWVVLLVQGTPVSKEYLAPFSIVVGFLVLLGLVFEKILWRQKWLHGWFVKRPDLRGTWRGNLKSSWINPKAKMQVPMIVCFMGVEQTFSTLQMHLITPESESWFIADDIRPSPSGQGYQVMGVYTNRPGMHLRGDRSEMHQGALILETHGPPAKPTALSGEYWTDRKTKGEMNFSDRVSQVFTRYEDADSAFNS